MTPVSTCRLATEISVLAVVGQSHHRLFIPEPRVICVQNPRSRSPRRHGIAQVCQLRPAGRRHCIVLDGVAPSGNRKQRAMDALSVVTELDAIRLSDWIDASGLSRSTAYELLKLLQIEPEARRVPTSRKPVSHLSADQVQLLQPWALEIAQRGATLPQVRERLGQLQTIPENNPGPSAIVPVDPMTALAAALHPPADPLRRAKALADAAELGVALSTAEMADVLGMAVGTVRGLPDGHQPRPGFTLRRQKAGNAVWWMVERPGRSQTVPAVTGAGGGRSVGFLAEPPVAARQTINVSAVALPAF